MLRATTRSALHETSMHARQSSSRNASTCRTAAIEDCSGRGMEVLVLGTSNCIGPASYAEKTGARLGVSLTNLSVGACSSTLGLYQLHKVQKVRRGVAFIDFAINDNDTGWNLWGKQHAPRSIADNIRTIVARLRSMNFLPILLVSASKLDLESEPYGNALHREICMKERINFIDLRSIVLGAINQGADRNALMHDDYHISCRAADETASFLAAIVRRMNETTFTLVPQSASILRGRVVDARELFPSAALVDRGSSLRSAFHGRLVIGDILHIPLGHNERVRGIMINVGAKGGTISLCGGELEIIKSMTSYWDAEHPDWFGSLLIDFAYPLLGSVQGVTIKIVGPDVAPTERTIHSKATLPGRYGEIEIEGVLLTECDNAQYDYFGPAYDWMPLDLSELSEGRQLSERLASLHCGMDCNRRA